ncbi:DUF4236 domain-containing protein [Butyricicoccus sp. AF35-5AC]|uniref:DUF4236 domain-containing protein n=1 Tax=Butyricicoccus sp. AF35-5AC TaxID=2292003 RepID=UPI000E4B26C4|nr:DUF4236 domain-containing protein [Butyricicoccus sp. AF35-5AC]RHP16478.1 DUF4236 domain-containing protein [Butyricicoccus sp. AF35-5AC]
MGFRFRKSFKIAPGVRVNVGKKSVGISAGVKGARVSVNSSGRKTTTVGLPGTGLSYSKTEKIGGSKTSIRSSSSNNAQPIRPDLQPAQPQEEKKKNGCCGCAVYAFIALLIIGALGSCIGGTDDKDKQTDTANDGTQAAVITQLTQTSDAVTEIDLGSSQTLTYTVDPSDFAMTADAVYATTSDSDVLAVSAECLSDPARVEVTLTGKAAGTADYTVRAADSDVQQTGQVTVHDRAAEQEAAEKAAAEKAAQEQASAEAAATQQAAQEQAAAQQSETVYITPSGKRWHRSASCAGKNARAVTMDQVGSRTPCQKCA